MVYTHKNSLGTDEQTKEQRFEALNRNHILNVYFQNLREEIPSFLKQQNSKHRLVHNDERQDTNLINIPAHLPMQFIAGIQESLDRHLAVARDAHELNQLVHQEFALMFSLLDISIQEMQTMLDEMSKNSEVPSMPYENFSFSSDLKEFLTVGPTVSLQGPLHANTLNQLFQEYQKMNNQQKNSSLDTVQNGGNSGAVEAYRATREGVEGVFQP